MRADETANAPKFERMVAAESTDFGLSLTEVAELVGITPSGVAHHERNAIRKLWRMKLPSRLNSPTRRHF